MAGLSLRRAAPAVFLFLLTCVGCGGGGYNAPTTPTSQPAPAPTATAADVSIAIVRDAGAQSFNPNPSTVRVGQTVAWRNTDATMHHVVEDGADTSGDDGYGYGNGGSTTGFDGGAEAPGASSSMLTARAAGTMRYHCAIHPGMVGTLTVTP